MSSHRRRVFAVALLGGLLVAPAVGQAAASAAARAVAGDGRGMATFGDRFMESFGTRPLDSIGPIPLTSMGGLDRVTAGAGSRVAAGRDRPGGSRGGSFARRSRRFVHLHCDDDALLRAARRRSVATLHGAVLPVIADVPQFALPRLPLPPLVLDSTVAEAELVAALAAEEQRSAASGDSGAAAAFRLAAH